jgi:hypothetical protein
LQELFPSHSKLQIDEALASTSGVLERAAEVLLQQQPAAPAAPGRSSYCSPTVRLVLTNDIGLEILKEFHIFK